MWWQSLRKQLEAAVNGALSVSLLQSTPIPLFLSGDTAITPSLLLSVLHSPPTLFFSFAPKFHLAVPVCQSLLLLFLCDFPHYPPSLFFSLCLSLSICLYAYSSLATAGCTSAHGRVHWVNWVVDMCLRAVGGGENRRGRGVVQKMLGVGGGEVGVQQGVGQLCQSPDSLLASPTSVVRLEGGAGGGSALTCSNL